MNIQEYIKSEDIIKRMFDNLSNTNTHITFCGKFKSGKSSLINSLLEAELLPVQDTTATAVITRIFYKNSPCAYKVIDGKKADIPFEQRAGHILAKEKTLKGIEIPDAVEVGLGIPNPLLNGIEFVDTPGLDDDEELTKITLAELNNTDLAVIVYDAIQLLSKSEKETVKEIDELLGGNVVFVVNRMDQAGYGGSVEDVKEAAEYYLNGFGNEIVGRGRIFYTSADGSKKNIDDFRNWLDDIIKSPVLLTRIRKTSRTSIIRNYLSERISLITDDIECAESEISRFHQKNDSIKAMKQSSLKDKLRSLRSDLQMSQVKMLEGLTGYCAGECEAEFKKIYDSTGWYTEYDIKTKAAAKKVLQDYVFNQRTLLISSYDLRFISVPPFDVSNTFNDITFPNAYKSVYKAKKGRAILAAAGAGLLASLINPAIGAGAAAGVYNSMKDGGSYETVLNYSCVSSSTAYMSGTVIPKMQELVKEFYRIINDTISSYEKNTSFSGEYEHVINDNQKILTWLKTMEETFENYEKELSLFA